MSMGFPGTPNMETLGHSTITLALGTYTSVHSEVAAEVAEAAAALVHARRDLYTRTRRRAPRENQEILVRRWGGWARTHDLTDYE
jgi:hypothetical protein